MYAWQTKSLSVGSVVALITLIDNAYTPIAIFNVIYVQYKLNRAAFSRYGEFLDMQDDKQLDGETGSGKSTVIKLLIGLLKYNEGEILLSGESLAHISLEALYRRMTYLSQEAPVFDGTVKENIVFDRGCCYEANTGLFVKYNSPSDCSSVYKHTEF